MLIFKSFKYNICIKQEKWDVMSLFYFNVISLYWNIILESVLFIRNVCIGDMYSLHVSWEFSCFWGIISNVGSIKTNENTYIEEIGITDVLFVSMYWCSSLCFLFYHMMHFNPNYLICILCRHVCYHLKNVLWVHPRFLLGFVLLDL